MLTINRLRILNDLRHSTIGISLTNEQYNIQGIDGVIGRLLYRNRHLLAVKMCETMRLYHKISDILVHWSIAKIKKLVSLPAPTATSPAITTSSSIPPATIIHPQPTPPQPSQSTGPVPGTVVIAISTIGDDEIFRVVVSHIKETYHDLIRDHMLPPERTTTGADSSSSVLLSASGNVTRLGLGMVPYKEIAAAAYELDRRELAKMLLDLETDMCDQVYSIASLPVSSVYFDHILSYEIKCALMCRYRFCCG